MLIFFTKAGIAQYSINLLFKHPVDSVVYFRVATFDDKLFIPKDTVYTNKGKAQLVYNSPIYGGIYYLYFPQSRKRILLCLENNDHFSLSFSGNNKWEDSIICTDSKNNIFLKYQMLERKFDYLDEEYSKLIKKGNATLKFKEYFFKEKKDSLSAFRETAIKKLNPTGLLYKYFTALNSIDEYVPNKNNYHQRNQLLNTINLKDPQVYFSSLPKKLLYEYLSSYPLIADSILKGVDLVMKKLNCKDKVYANIFDYFASVLQNSSIKDNMKGYTQLIEKYLIKSNCSFLPKKAKDEIISKYSNMKKLVTMDTATNIILKDTSGVFQSLYEQLPKYDYTLISFYDPTCEHCQYQMPLMDSTIKVIIRNTGLKILQFAICNTDLSYENEWKKFIILHKLEQHYVHLILGDSLSARVAYGAYSNPIFFLLDRNKKIIIGKGDVVSIKRYLLSVK